MIAQYDQLGPYYDLAYDSASEGADPDFTYYLDMSRRVSGPVLEMGSGKEKCDSEAGWFAYNCVEVVAVKQK